MMSEMTFLEKLRWYLIGIAGKFILWVWFSCSHLVVLGEEKYSQIRAEGKPVVFALWHQRLLIVPYFFRKRNVIGFVSPSRDGEIIVQIGLRWGFKVLRGSSSHSVAKSWVKMIRELKQGGEVIMIPDGPKGPAHSFKPGSIKLAQKTGASIVPFSYSCIRRKHINSWDRMLWFFPFQKVVAIYGEPIEIPAQLTEEEFEAARRHLEQVLIALDEYSDSYFKKTAKS
jgi:lysophospholipid acyltransferase (LPLAT)-like uncharacterized protein